jgi:hypothetical protein
MSEIFKFNEARFKAAKKASIVGGMVILVAITLLSCVSSFMIYREGFADMPWIIQAALSVFAVLVVEGAFLWLVHGFTMVFSGYWERFLSFLGMWALSAVMLINIVTHFMMVKGAPLHPFQEAWLAWGAVSIFIGVLVLILAIKLSDPVIRFIRLELRVLGREQDTILNARRDGLDSEIVHQAMEQRAQIEAEALAARLLGTGSSTQQSTSLQRSNPQWRGGRRVDNGYDEEDQQTH